MHIAVSSLVIGVRDLAKARPFYENVFGFSFDEFRPPFASASLGNVEFNIEENADYRDGEWASKYIGGRKCVGFEVDDLELFLANARQFGAVVIKDAVLQPWGWKEAVIADLDGNEFVVEQEIG